MNIKSHAVFFGIVCFCPQVVFAEDLRTKLIECASIEGSEKRFNCYEMVAKPLLSLGEDKAAQSKEPVTLSDQDAQEVIIRKKPKDENGSFPADLGGEQFNTKVEDKPKRSNIVARGRITSCKKAVDGKWFFIFENGQIWKQVGSSRRRYRQCDFFTSIKKDRIGFKMLVDGEKRSIRIKRHL